MRILLVEDDEGLGNQVADRLEREGYQVRWRTRGDHALAEDPNRYDLVALDLMLPGLFGMDVLRSMRERSDVPILVLSAKQDSASRLRAFELGADDYVLKPFWPDELVARVGARLRRPILERGGELQVGPLTLSRKEAVARRDGEALDLTRAEFDVLFALVRRKGSAVTREWLLDHTLCPDRSGTDRSGTDRAVDVHVSRLRRKLGPLGETIQTVWGVGYRFELEPSS